MNSNNETVTKKKSFRYDLALIASLLLLSLVAVGVLLLTRESGGYAVVEIDGKEVARYSLAENGEYSLNGGTNILVIENGYAYMKSADCPGFQDCVEKGKIRYNGEFIICSPNRVNVYITGDGGVDLVS